MPVALETAPAASYLPPEGLDQDTASAPVAVPDGITLPWLRTLTAAALAAGGVLVLFIVAQVSTILLALQAAPSWLRYPAYAILLALGGVVVVLSVRGMWTLMRLRAGRADPAAMLEAQRRLAFWRGDPAAPTWTAA